MLRIASLTLLVAFSLYPGPVRAQAPGSVERWGVFEAVSQGADTGNPFLDVKFGATFRFGFRAIDVEGFYDGSGTYRVRFMPDSIGDWSYVTKSNRPELDGKSGKFTCLKNTGLNHGPVR